MKFAKDQWDSKELSIFQTGILSYDKVQHFFGGFLTTFFLTLLTSLWWAVGISILFWWLWEVKDGYILYESLKEKGYSPFICWFGGDGFSWKDGLASTAGVLFIFVLLSFILFINLIRHWS